MPGIAMLPNETNPVVLTCHYHGNNGMYRHLKTINVPRNPEGNLVPCRQCQIAPGVTQPRII